MTPLRGGLLFLATVALVFAGTGSARAERTIGLSSGSFEFLLEPGANGDGEVIAINDGDEPIKVLVYTANQVIDEDGESSFEVPSRDVVGFLDSPASWVRIDMPAEAKAVGNTPYLEMEPGDRIPVAFNIAVPGGAAPGDNNVILFFEVFEFSSGQQVNTSEITGRLGTRLRIRIDGDLVERMDVRPFVVPGFVLGSKIPYEFVVTNGGNINKRIGLDIALVDRNEDVLVESTLASDTPVYAGGLYKSAGDIVLPASVFGRHEVVLTMEYPTEDAEGQALAPVTVEKSRSVWIIPLWFAYAVGGLIVYLVGLIVWNLAKRAARKRHSHDRTQRRRKGAASREESRTRAEARRSRRAATAYEEEHPPVHHEPEEPGFDDSVDASPQHRPQTTGSAWGDDLDVDFDLHHGGDE